MYLRIWEYDVPSEAVDRFVVAYGASGDWAQLFARADGFVGTELFRGADAPNRFVTIDRWRDRSDWRAFLQQWQGDYQALDTKVEHLTAVELALFQGTVPMSVGATRQSADIDGVDGA